jgi:hypothetical protein
MRLVTSCTGKHFEEYAYRLFDSFKHFPKGTELWWYTEGFTLPHQDGIVQIDIASIPELTAFKEKHAAYKAPNYLFDVARFSNKVYAACEALKDYDGIGGWIDADCVLLKDIPEGYIEGHLQEAYIALLQRKGMYSETGFWLMDCSKPEHRDFLSMWTEWYRSEAFKGLTNWTDCETLDATIRRFQKDGLKVTSLSAGHEKDMHPLTKIALGKFIDHTKGSRKKLGYSPERESPVAWEENQK